MSQLRAELRYSVHPDFEAIPDGDQVWGAGGPHAQEWAAEVEGTASYRAALRHAPIGGDVWHTPV